VLANKAIGPGGTKLSWSLSNERSGWTTQATSSSSSTHRGLDVDVEAGAGVKVLTGYSKEESWGLTTDESHTVSTSSSFDLGGTMIGFPITMPDANGTYKPVNWPLQCTYQIRPYYYETTVESDYGYKHRFIVVDYTVPAWLDRTKNMKDCRDGKYTFPAVIAESEEEAALTAEPELE
jgi:hypothetical protein